jgi:hypothetical protein
LGLVVCVKIQFLTIDWPLGFLLQQFLLDGSGGNSRDELPLQYQVEDDDWNNRQEKPGHGLTVFG